MILEKYRNKKNNGYRAKCVCDECGKKFDVCYSYVDKKKNQFCCLEHFYKWFSENRKGYKQTEEHKQNLSEAKKQYYKQGNKSPAWNGGINICRGYIRINKPEHPNCSKNGYVMQHRLIMEESLGRYLEPDEVVHHINENRADNRMENLELMTKSQHRKLHTVGRQIGK